MSLGVRDKKIKDRSLREPELSRKRAAEICQAAEAANVQFQTLTGQTSADVHTVKKKDFRGQKTGKPGKGSTKKKQESSCKQCGQKHKKAPKKCPAYGQICVKCKGKNHFASQCFSKKMHTVEDCGSDTDSEGYLIQKVTDSSSSNEWISTVDVDGSLIPLITKSTRVHARDLYRIHPFLDLKTSVLLADTLVSSRLN